MQNHSVSFESDNCSGVHPRIMKALEWANRGYTSGYGYDEFTQLADKEFNLLFERQVDTFYVFNGTGSNCAALAHLIRRPYEAILCSSSAHIHTAETGAPERLAGGKLIPIPSSDGRITSEALLSQLSSWQSEHVVIPRVLSLTQITDAGFRYEDSHIKELCEIAHKHGLIVHVDGARIANAVVANQNRIIPMICDSGVDVLSFGGTKNGFMFGEAVIFLNRELSPYFKNTRKSCGQLPSKMRFIAVQFYEALRDGLWLEMAKNSNDMAQYLYRKMKESNAFSTPYRPDANEIFAFVNASVRDRLQKEFRFNNFGPLPDISRFVTSFDTKKEDVDALISTAEILMGEEHSQVLNGV